ncbi:MAG: hypothetical protein DRP56_08410 [Planctomycetota bacterium]|nr:MAG: hypothetical protein DRP56_08410 [Planctomycetota bacterium]
MNDDYKQFRQIIDGLEIDDRPSAEHKQALRKQMLAACKETSSDKPAIRIQPVWSKIMKSKITKSAAAAVVFIAVILGVNFIPGSNGPVALASIIETFKNATCISYDIQMGEDSPLIHDTIYQNIIRREALGAVSIIDLDNGRILSLMENEKQAVLINFDGLPEMPKNYIDHLVNILTKIQSKEDVESEQLGSREIDGQKQIGYFFTSENLKVELWINADTSLPATIIATRPGLETTMKNFDFDEDIDLTLFDLTPPEGYTLIDAQNMIDFKKDDNEETFIEGLRLQTVLYDGWFPQDISIESYMKRAADIGGLVEQKFEGTLAQMQAGINLGKGLVFLRFWKGQGPWHYAGNGVQLGQVEEPIFWYQPKDSNIFRVIFGDLHVEEVQPEDLDALVSARESTANFGYQLWEKKEFVTHQEDELYVKADGMIEVHSKIDIRKGPMNLSRVNLELPYENAELLSATFGQTSLPYEQGGKVQYAFYPDGEQIITGEHVINLVWQFPLENLKITDYGYQVQLRSFLPATSYKITAILTPDSGYAWGMSQGELEKAMKRMPTREPDNPRMLTLFTIGKADGKTTFGTCGLCIKPE